jgi:predicted NBD/HSP70 family sugar kinase
MVSHTVKLLPMISSLNPTMQRIIALIRHRGVLSRAELADRLGLSRPAITQTTRVLEEGGWVETDSIGGNTRGQPKQNLRLCARAAVSPGVFIQNDRVTLMLADLNGRAFASAEIVPTPADPCEACRQIAAQFRELLRAHRIAAARILAVGVATSGFFLEDSGMIWTPTEMGDWRRFPLRETLAREMGCAVVVENDGNAAALAEAMAGAGRHYENFFYLYLAYGIGGGFIHHGRIFHGTHGNAGEIGLLVPHRPSVRPTLTSLAVQLKRTHGSLDASEIQRLYERCDPAMMRFLRAAIAALNQPLTAVIALFDPAAIIIGGKFPRSVLRHIVEHVDVSNRLTGIVPEQPAPAVIMSEINEDAGLLGAALLPLQQAFGPAFGDSPKPRKIRF